MSLNKRSFGFGLFASDEEIREWVASARTSATKQRIRRWARVERVGMILLLTSVALLLAAVVASIATGIWATFSSAEPTGMLWWLWGATMAVLACGITTSVVGNRRRQRACFADGYVSEGVVDRAIEHPGSGDDQTWFDLRISAPRADGGMLRRRLHLEGEGFDRRVGRPIRFRHNSLDPDALDDVLFDGWQESTPAPGRHGEP